MTRKVLIILMLINASSVAEVPWNNNQSKAENLIIKLVTFGPGDDIMSLWGHGGILIQDSVLNYSRIYNFGVYRIEPATPIKFTTGRMWFWVEDFPDSSFLKTFIDMNRDIYIQHLNLIPEKRMQMAVALAAIISSEEKYYIYNQYYNNCSTKIRDMINEALGGALYESTNYLTAMTFRDHTRRYLANNFSLELLLMYFMNDLIDRPIRQWEEMFLPDKLAKYAEAVNYKDENGKIHKLVNESYFYYKSTRDPIPESIPLHWPRAIISGMMLGGLAVGFVLWFNYGSKFWPRTLYSYYTLILGVIIGGPGMYLASGIFFTDHEVAFYNENLLLVNPLTFLFIYLGLELQKNKAVIWKWQRWNWSLHLALLTSAALLKFLPSFDQDNTLIFAFLTPIYVLNTLAVWMISD